MSVDVPEYKCEYTRQSISDLLDKLTLDFPDPYTTERITARAGEDFEAINEVVWVVFRQLIQIMVELQIKKWQY